MWSDDNELWEINENEEDRNYFIYADFGGFDIY